MNHYQTFSVAALVTLGLAGNARANTCGAPDSDPAFSGDAHYIQYSCDDAQIDYFWSAFDFDKDDWDGSFGWDEACNVNLPLARTMNALYALQYSSYMPDYSSNDGYQGKILEWAGVYAAKKIDELDARCGDGGAYAQTWWGPIIDNKTELYKEFFYNLTVAGRASAIIHEARHASGVDHDSSDCVLGKDNCDKSWNSNGAFRYQVSWASQFVRRGVGATSWEKARTIDLANNLLDTAFAQDPGFRLMESDVPLLADTNNDGRDEIVVWRPSTGMWYGVDPMTSNWTIDDLQWGDKDDVPLIGDFNGDGKDDLAVWRAKINSWNVRAATGEVLINDFKLGEYHDAPLAGDLDGDGKDEMIIWRPKTGNWFARTINGVSLLHDEHWGTDGDIPLVGDFNGDGKDDLAVWRSLESGWHIRTATGTVLVDDMKWGLPGDVPLAGDVNGDGKDDLIVWRPSTGSWFAMTATGNILVMDERWGEPGDIPLLGKINYNQTEDLVVWRPTLATWYAMNSTGSVIFGSYHFGATY